MAVVLPALATIGGGSAAMGAVIVGGVATSTALGVNAAIQQRRAGKISEKQSELNAAAEGDAARQREVERKQNLLRAISSQEAEAGARGIAFGEGSPARIAELDIDKANTDLAVDRASSLQRQRSLRSQGRAARISGNAQFAAGLAGAAQSSLSLVDMAKKPKKD